MWGQIRPVGRLGGAGGVRGPGFGARDQVPRLPKRCRSKDGENMTISNWIALLSGVALFLFGMLLMGDGLKRVAGSRLELVLYRLSSTPLKGVLLGTGVTAVIQSSSATSVMVVGFVNSGMMRVRQAIGVVLGSILGTSVTGWIIALSSLSGGSEWTEVLSTATLTGLIAVAGIILRMFCKKTKYHHVGDILMGFAVLMFGMQAMSDAVSPLRESPVFLGILTRFSNPLVGMLVGTLVTSVLQSASAAVGILQALSATGVITLEIAFPIVMGIAIGAAVPVLLSALGATLAGRRTALIYLIINVLGAAVWSLVFYSVNAIHPLPFLGMNMNAVTIAALNSLFRLATVLVLAPAIGLIEKLTAWILPERGDGEHEMAEIDRLEDRFINHPALAIEQSRVAMCSMARKAMKNLGRSFALLHNYSDEGFRRIQEKEDVVDRYEDKLGTYLVKITEKELSHDENQQVSLFLHTISDFERIADHAVNISKVAAEIHEKHLEFSPDAVRELNVVSEAVTEVVRLTVEAFTQGSRDTAMHVEPLEELIDDLCDEVKLHHVQRIQTGDCTLSHGFVFNDLLTNFERVADHCSNVAVAMIELQSDVFDTHEYLNGVKQRKSEAFSRYYDEYRARFSL